MKQYLIGMCIKAGHQTMCDDIVAVVVMTVEVRTAARKKSNQYTIAEDFNTSLSEVVTTRKSVSAWLRPPAPSVHRK